MAFMNILYIGAFPPAFLVNRSGGKIDSLYRASEAIISGLRSQEGVKVSVITSPDIASWPRGPLYVHREEDEAENLTLVSSLNISLVKQLWTIWSLIKESRKIIKKTDGKIVVVIPYVVFRHVLTLRILKLLYPTKVIQACVVPDVFFPNNWLLKRVNSMTEKMAAKFDAFILYTKKMAEHFHIKEGHYEVIEGFREVPDRRLEKSNDFKVVYAGSLNLNYGVGRLVESFSLLKDADIQLHLYGAGTAEELIKERSAKDRRIVFHGRVSNAEATDAVYGASVLINPRNYYDGEYTEYSFPSKDIEYMATGIPVLLCVLPGMPKEYQGRFVDMGDGSPEQIAAAIQKVKVMSFPERERIGREAKDFITERMDCHKQGQRITNLFNRVINNSIC